MGNFMRCLFCGLLQDEPHGVKQCTRCGGELVFENERLKGKPASYISVTMELDQIYAPSDRVIDRFVLFTLQSPKTVPPEYRAEEQKGRSPVNFNPVIDRSGSMHGRKIEFAKEAIIHSLTYLKEGDAFSLTVYDDHVEAVFQPTRVTKEFLTNSREIINLIHPGGSTALHTGLEQGIAHAQKLKRNANLVLLLSDGLANVGITDLEIIGQAAKKARAKGVTISAVGIGYDYNEGLMTEVAVQGGGRFYHLEDPSQITPFISGELGEVANWAGKGLVLCLRLPDGASAMAVTNAHPVKQSENLAVITIGDLPCDSTLEIPVRLSFPPQSAGAKLRIEGNLAFSAPSGAKLETPLNPVTLRVVESRDFQPKFGVVESVLYRVFQQRKSASYINVRQAMASRRRDSFAEEKQVAEELVEYASRLSYDKAAHEVEELRFGLDSLRGPSPMAKRTIYDSYHRMRGQKDFRKKP